MSGELAGRVLAEVPRALEDLRALVAVPSVSSDPQHANDVDACAALVAELFRAEGAAARVVRCGTARPAVVGRKQGPAGAPTVLLYAHHDVQPTGDVDRWTSDPFTLVRRGDRLYGRGSSDDKAAVALHLALLRAFGDELPVTLVLLVEGEEEIGSPGFDGLLTELHDELAADVVVVPDAVSPSPATPSLTTLLRGNADLVVELATLSRPVHSGLYGGVLPCALTTLVQLLATLHDATGALAVRGLEADGGEAPTVLTDLAGVALPGVAETGAGPLGVRSVLAPSVTVLALDAVPVTEASNVLHPRARAKLGVRVPPGQDSTAALLAVEAHLREHVLHGAHLVVQPGQAGRGFHATSSSAGRAWARATARVYDTPSLDVGAGGSIPFLATLAGAFPTAAFLVTAVQDSGSSAHSYDESLHVDGFAKACVAHGLLLEELARS